MRKLDDVGREELKDFLGKGWLTHDGMWFYHTCLDAGMEKANRLNIEASFWTCAATPAVR